MLNILKKIVIMKVGKQWVCLQDWLGYYFLYLWEFKYSSFINLLKISHSQGLSVKTLSINKGPEIDYR